jgi:hypothetical protein
MSENIGSRSETPVFFYIVDGKKEGPVDKQELLRLKEGHTVSATTLIWTKSYGSDWKEIGKASELRDADEPPLIPDKSIPMIWLVLLVLSPIIMMFGELILTDNVDGVTDRHIYISYWVINSFLAIMDERTIKRADRFQSQKGLLFWAIFLVPVYIFIRGRRTGLGVWPFFAWIVAVSVSAMSIETLRGEIFFGLGLPTCDAPVSQTQIRGLYSQIPIVLGAEVIDLTRISELSTQGTQSRKCTAVILDTRSQETRVNYTITSRNDDYYFEIEVNSP